MFDFAVIFDFKTIGRSNLCYRLKTKNIKIHFFLILKEVKNNS
ncbi:hypothetical protein SXYLSMQ121_2486 [Staphylococcus xylosus]|nr:hypothetical protein SXYLSMQ121_2486 [Staphylococcus xylosus]